MTAVVPGRGLSEWTRAGTDMDGIPLWQWNGEPVYAATRDTDQLIFLGAALAWFDEMSAEDFHAFISSAPVPAHSATTDGAETDSERAANAAGSSSPGRRASTRTQWVIPPTRSIDL
ncbi:hypothetical protein GCM10023195_16110 [Actinoallomurus liliacearum]|uniref:Uncharacterized protein n=1 Tax=Actinoallomurus liliacearum TaxID=1080073 RepID=A0ABP8TF84_9ACTN